MYNMWQAFVRNEFATYESVVTSQGYYSCCSYDTLADFSYNRYTALLPMHEKHTINVFKTIRLPITDYVT